MTDEYELTQSIPVVAESKTPFADKRKAAEAEKRRAFRALYKQAQEVQDDVEPTPEEARNGWTRESLAQYRAEQLASQTGRIWFKPKSRPAVQNSSYSPLRWYPFRKK